MREDGDADWESRIGRENNIPRFTGKILGETSAELVEGRNLRGENIFKLNDKNSYLLKNQFEAGINSGHNMGLQISDGLKKNENTGLELEDVKRRRSDVVVHAIMDTDDRIHVIPHKDAALSETDCDAS